MFHKHSCHQKIDTNNHIRLKGTIMNIRKTLHMHKHKTQNKLIPEQIQIGLKHNKSFEALNIGNAQTTNLFSISDYSNTTCIRS